MNNFINRAYGLAELALLYFPFSSAPGARSQLKKWIAHPLLLDKLTATGYVKGQKILTPLQVSIITDHLGPP